MKSTPQSSELIRSRVRVARSIREFKIYDATVAKTSLKIASSSLSIFLVTTSVCVTFKVLLRRNFHIFFPTVFLKNVKYRCKLREITMNRVRRNFFCRDITLQKSQKLVRHYFVRKPRVRCILQQRFVL